MSLHCSCNSLKHQVLLWNRQHTAVHHKLAFFLSFSSIPLNYACCFHHSHSSKDIFFCQLMVQWKCEGVKNGRMLHWRIAQMNSVDIHRWQRAAGRFVEVQSMLLKSAALLIWGSMWRVRETLGLPYIRVNSTHMVCLPPFKTLYIPHKKDSLKIRQS